MTSLTYGSDPVSPNTTYVQADPSTFRAVVQKLTGAPDDPSAQKLPLRVSGLPSRLANPKAADMGPRRPSFKLHERRQAAKKLELNLTFSGGASFSPHFVRPLRGSGGGGGVLVSPVSTLEFLARGSPRTPATPCTEEEEEEVEKRAIAEKGFYLHRSPLSTPRGSDPPELLPLFPLCSPTAKDHTHHINNSSYTTS